MSIVRLAVGRARRLLADLAAQLNAYGQVIGTYADVTLSASVATTLDVTVYESKLTTASGGVHADEFALPDPATTGKVGQRHLVTYVAETNNGDTAVSSTAFEAYVSFGALTVSAITFDTVGEWCLFEHRGAKWEIIAAASGVVTAA